MQDKTPEKLNADKPVFPMRINKFLALRKDSTRRGADEIIKKNQVFINGRLAVLGDKVQESDKVEIRFRGKSGPMPASRGARGTFSGKERRKYNVRSR